MLGWLEDYEELENETSFIEHKLEREKRELRRWTEGDLYKVRLTEGSIASGLEERIEIMEYELAHKMNDMFNFRKLISTFKDLDNQILYKRNIEGKSLVEISVEMQYSYSYIKSKHAEIMRMIKFAQEINS